MNGNARIYKRYHLLADLAISPPLKDLLVKHEQSDYLQPTINTTKHQELCHDDNVEYLQMPLE